MAAGMASASSFTLRIEKNVHVTNDPTKAFRVKAVNTHQPVAVGPPAEVLTAPTLRRHYHTDVEIVRAADGTLAVIPLRTSVLDGRL